MEKTKEIPCMEYETPFPRGKSKNPKDKDKLTATPLGS